MTLQTDVSDPRLYRDDSWAPLKAMPDGAHTVGAVKIALKNVVDKMWTFKDNEQNKMTFEVSNRNRPRGNGIACLSFSYT